MSRAVIDLDEALAAVVELFQRKGYEHASIEDVVQTTGLNRYAIYQAFGGKRDLFLAAVDRYRRDSQASLLAKLDEPGACPVAALRAYFDEPLEEVARDMASGAAGSLMCQAFFEVAPHDPVVHERLQGFLEEKRAVMLKALQAAQDSGLLSAQMTPEAAVDLLTAVMFGVAAQAYAGADQAVLSAAMDAAFRALATPPHGASAALPG